MSDEIEKYDPEYESSKEAFLQEFERHRPDLAFPDSWSKADKKKAAQELRPAATRTRMMTSIPMICKGKDCFAAPSCPLLKQGIDPSEDGTATVACPIEMSMVQQLFYDYADELKVDLERIVEVSMVRDLVDQEIQQVRKSWILGQEHFIQENVAGVDEMGNVITKKELHYAVDYEDKIHRRKEKIRNALLATREAKSKAGESHVDSVQVVANLVNEMRRGLSKQSQAELDSVEYDEYIEADVIEDDPKGE